MKEWTASSNVTLTTVSVSFSWLVTTTARWQKGRNVQWDQLSLSVLPLNSRKRQQFDTDLQLTEGLTPTVLVSTRHSITVMMPPLECTKAWARSWIVALRISQRQGYATEAAEATEEHSSSNTTTEEESHGKYQCSAVLYAWRRPTHRPLSQLRQREPSEPVPQFQNVSSLTWILGAAHIMTFTISRSEEGLKHTCPETTWVFLPAEMMKNYIWYKQPLKGFSKYCSF